MPTRTHTDAERTVRDLALTFGWRHHHSRCGETADGYADGFPSDTLVRHGRVVFLFLGSRGLIPPAEAWANALRDVRSIEVHVVRQGDTRTLVNVLRPGTSGSARQ